MNRTLAVRFIHDVTVATGSLRKTVTQTATPQTNRAAAGLNDWHHTLNLWNTMRSELLHQSVIQASQDQLAVGRSITIAMILYEAS